MNELRPGIAGVTALAATDLVDGILIRLAVTQARQPAFQRLSTPSAEIARQVVSPGTLALLRHLAGGVMVRPPDRVICRSGTQYLERWYLRRGPDSEESDCAMFLHRILAADEPPAHDHPWTSCSILVDGVLAEQFVSLAGVDLLVAEAGDRIVRTAECMHLLAPIGGPAITICATGARFRQWGFARP